MSLDQSFGPVRMRVNTQSARGNVKIKSQGVFATVLKFIALLLRERVSSAYEKTPFFHIESGVPIVVPTVLSLQERQALRERL